MADPTDEELMVMFQNGNTCAFERLFERYRVPVFNFLFRLLHYQRESAEDVLQDIFVKLAKAKDLYDPRLRFRTWFFTIARNHGLNHLRSRASVNAMKTISLDAMAEATESRGAQEVSGKDDTFGDIALKDNLVLLERTIDRLPEPARDIFLLHALEGLPHDEIARTLQMNPATVRTHYHRARVQLCRLLAENEASCASPRGISGAAKRNSAVALAEIHGYSATTDKSGEGE